MTRTAVQKTASGTLKAKGAAWQVKVGGQRGEESRRWECETESDHLFLFLIFSPTPIQTTWEEHQDGPLLQRATHLILIRSQRVPSHHFWTGRFLTSKPLQVRDHPQSFGGGCSVPNSLVHIDSLLPRLFTKSRGVGRHLSPWCPQKQEKQTEE